MYYSLVTPAAVDLLTLAQCKKHLRVDDTVGDYDEMITSLIDVVQSLTRATLGRACTAETWSAAAPAPTHNGGFILDRGPNPQVIGLSVLRAGAYAALSLNTDYIVRPLSADRLLVRSPRAANGALGTFTPYDDDEAAFLFTLTCGFGSTAANVPAAIVQAMLLEMGDLFNNRESSRPGGIVDNPAARRLLAPFRADIV